MYQSIKCKIKINHTGADASRQDRRLAFCCTPFHTVLLHISLLLELFSHLPHDYLLVFSGVLLCTVLWVQVSKFQLRLAASERIMVRDLLGGRLTCRFLGLCSILILIMLMEVLKITLKKNCHLQSRMRIGTYHLSNPMTLGKVMDLSF